MGSRASWATLLLTWPVGLLLVLAHMEIGAVTTPVIAVLEALYLTGVIYLLRRLGADRDPAAAALALIGPGLFFLVGFAGPPSADEPGLFMLNTAALLAAALALLAVVASVVWSHRHSPGIAAVLPLLSLLGMGTTMYCANLVARFAVVFSGAAEQQAAVEDSAWIAFEYLRGLDSAPGFMAYLLVWLDLLQLFYVASTFVCVGAVARMLGAGDAISQRTARGISVAGTSLASVIVGGVALAAMLPRDLDLLPAWAAFAASIPFMTTLLPFLLGVALLSRTVGSDSTARVLVPVAESER